MTTIILERRKPSITICDVAKVTLAILTFSALLWKYNGDDEDSFQETAKPEIKDNTNTPSCLSRLLTYNNCSNGNINDDKDTISMMSIKEYAEYIIEKL